MAHFYCLIVLFDMHSTVVKYYWYNAIIWSKTVGTTRREETGNSQKWAKLLEAMYIFWPGRKTVWDSLKILFAYWVVTFWLTQVQFFWGSGTRRGGRRGLPLFSEFSIFEKFCSQIQIYQKPSIWCLKT